MKTQNTLENKAKFFAQYFGQEIAEITKGNYTHKIGSIELINSTVLSLVTSERILKIKYKLKLKPLSKISDEDAIEVAKIVSPSLFLSLGDDNKHYLEKYNSDWITVKHDRKITSVDIDLDGYVFEYHEDENYTRPAKSYAGTDFLRSKGYALPYMDLSINDLIEYGWIKLE